MDDRIVGLSMVKMVFGSVAGESGRRSSQLYLWYYFVDEISTVVWEMDVRRVEEWIRHRRAKLVYSMMYHFDWEDRLSIDEVRHSIPFANDERAVLYSLRKSPVNQMY